MKTTIKKFIPYFLSIIAIIAFVIYLYRNAEQYRELLNFSFGMIVTQAILMSLFILGHGINNYLFLQGLSIPVSYNEGIGLAAVNMLANQLPFTGGIIAKSVYLKQRYHLSYSRFLSATVALYNIFVLTNGIIGLSVLIYWRLVNNISFTPWLFVVFIGMVATVFMFWLPVDRQFVPNKIRQKLVQLADGWRTLAQNRKLVGQLMGVQMALIFIFAWRFWIAFHMLSQDIKLSQCLLFAAATIVVSLVNITPGGLGIREAIVGGLASLVGFDTGVSIVAVSIDRLISTFMIIIIGSIYTVIFGSHLTASESIRDEE